MVVFCHCHVVLRSPPSTIISHTQLMGRSVSDRSWLNRRKRWLGGSLVESGLVRKEKVEETACRESLNVSSLVSKTWHRYLRQCPPKELAHYCRTAQRLAMKFWGRDFSLKMTRCSLREIVDRHLNPLRPVTRIPHMGCYILKAPRQARHYYPFRGESGTSAQRLRRILPCMNGRPEWGRHLSLEPLK